MINYLISGGLLVSPFVIRMTSYADTMRMSKEIFILCLITLTLFMHEKAREIDLKLKWLLFSLIFFAYMNTQIFASVEYWTQFQSFSAFILFLYYMLTAKLNEKIITRSIVGVCLINCVWVILNSFGIELYGFIVAMFFDFPIKTVVMTGEASTGFLVNQNLDGALIAITAPLFFKKSRIFLLPVLMYALYLGQSAMPIVTFLGSSLYFVYNHFLKEKWFPYLCFFISSMYFILLGFPSGLLNDSYRSEAWGKSITLMDNFINGMGLGHFSLNFSKYYIVGGQTFRHMHNEFLQVFYNFGIVGSVIFLFLIHHFIKNTKNKVYLSCIFGILVNSFGNFLFHVPVLSLVSILLLALGYNNGSTMERKSTN